MRPLYYIDRGTHYKIRNPRMMSESDVAEGNRLYAAWHALNITTNTKQCELLAATGSILRWIIPGMPAPRVYAMPYTKRLRLILELVDMHIKAERARQSEVSDG